MPNNSFYRKYIDRLKHDRLKRDDWSFIEALEKRGFCGKIILHFGEVTINFQHGGVAHLNVKMTPSIEVEETVKQK